MKTEDEMLTACENIKYYSSKIRELAKKEFDLCCEEFDLHSVEADNYVMCLEEINSIQGAIEFKIHQTKRNIEYLQHNRLIA